MVSSGVKIRGGDGTWTLERVWDRSIDSLCYSFSHGRTRYQFGAIGMCHVQVTARPVAVGIYSTEILEGTCRINKLWKGNFTAYVLVLIGMTVKVKARRMWMEKMRELTT